MSLTHIPNKYGLRSLEIEFVSDPDIITMENNEKLNNESTRVKTTRLVRSSKDSGISI